MTPLEQALAGPLRALTDYRRFLIYKVVPDPKRPGKTNKFPVDPATGAYVDASTQGLTCDQALAALPDDGEHGVGFYFDEADGFWFLDVDGAWSPDEGWSPLVGRLDALLPGAAREVSHSGTGLHYFGRGPVPEHRCRDVRGDGLELYSGRRFVALTGAHASGSADAQPLEGLAQLVAEWFPALATGSGGHDGGGPREDWSGPDDDDELIALIEASTHRVPAFGDSGPAATDAELWRGDAQVLAELYPETDPSKGRPFDASTAGWALARALGYWAGCDLERMERLLWRAPFMGVSGWDAGKAYRTLRKRVAEWPADRKVLQRAEPLATATQQGPSDPAPEMPDFSDGYVPRAGCGAEDLVAFFHGMTYVANRHEVLMPNGEFLSPDKFNAKLGGPIFRIDDTKVTRKPFECLIGAKGFEARKVDRETFDPRLPFGAIRIRNGVSEVNTYRPLGCAREAGDVAPFLSRYEKIVPDDRDRRILFSWVAAAVQSPGVKFQWALVLQSEAEGLGKSLLGQVLRNALGNPYFHPLTQKERKTDAFSGWKYRKLAVLVDEITRSETRGDNEGMWKDLITSDYQGVEAKGVDARMEEVFYNLIFTTNERGVFRLSDASRRFAVFHLAIQSDEEKRAAGLDDDGFTEWMKSGGMERVVAWFDAYPIDPEFDPRTVITAPRTSSWEDAVAESRDALCSVLEEAIEANNRPGLMRGWASVKAAVDALHEGRYKVTPQAVARLLGQLGYEPHPGLRKNGRTSRRTLTDNAEVRLFIRRGHPHSYMQGAVVEQQYDEDQKL